MSNKYDIINVVVPGNYHELNLWLLQDALEDIHERISRLEAEAQKPQYTLGDPNRDGQCRAVGDGYKPPQSERREPGWYPVWKHCDDAPSLWRWSLAGFWVSWDGMVTRREIPTDIYVIGSRIPEPSA